MKKTYFVSLFVVLASMFFTACSKSSYEYPKVQLELIDVEFSGTGKVLMVTLGDNKQYVPQTPFVLQFNEEPKVNVIRGLSHLEFSEDKTELIKMYNFVPVVSLNPIEEPESFDSDPIEGITSYWFSNDNRYLNVRFSYRSLNEKAKHEIGVVFLDNVSLFPGHSLDLKLVHKADGDLEGNLQKMIVTIDLQAKLASGIYNQITFSAKTTKSNEYQLFCEHRL